MLPSGWRWSESGTRTLLLDSFNRNRATIYTSYDVSLHTWFVWDEDGVGGENDAADTLDKAKYEVERAFDRWGWSNESPPPPPPAPLTPQEIDRVEEALRDTYGDADEAGEFSQRVVDVLRAYERVLNGEE